MCVFSLNSSWEIGGRLATSHMNVNKGLDKEHETKTLREIIVSGAWGLLDSPGPAAVGVAGPRRASRC